MVAYEKMDPDTAAKYREAENLRKLAFLGVALSTVATLVCVISVPMIYNYMQHVQSVLQNEVDFCKVRLIFPFSSHIWSILIVGIIVTATVFQSRSGSLWSEVTRTQMMKGTNTRIRRQAVEASGYGQPPPAPGPASTEAPATYAPEAPVESQTQAAVVSGGGCCGCGTGAPGPQGPPGPDGKDGKTKKKAN